MGYHFAMAGRVVLPDPHHLHVHVHVRVRVQVPKEPFQDGLIPAIAFSTPAVRQEVLLHRPLMPGTGVLRAPARNLVASAGPALPSETASCHQLLCRAKESDVDDSRFFLSLHVVWQLPDF